MKIIINKKIILNVLFKIQGLTSRKTTLAITENVLITTLENAIQISVTDLETSFKGKYPASVKEQGAITINSKILFEIIKDFPDDDISITQVENNWINIGNKNVEYNIMGMDINDFPEILEFNDIYYYDIDSSFFKQMIERMTVITSPSDEKRVTVKGILFETLVKDEKTVLRMVSTDGGRLSVTDYFYNELLEDICLENTIIPKKGMSEVVKFLKNDGIIKIGFKENHCIIKNDDEIIIIRLFEGNFLKYKKVMDKENHHIIKIKKQEFLMMLKRMSILSSNNYKGVIFDINKDKMIISSTNPTSGESKEDMNIEYDGEHIQVAYNPKFYIDTINLINKDIIFLYVLDEKSPSFLEEINEKNYLTAIMPMKV